MDVIKNTIPVAFLPANIDACALYRMFFPHLNLEESVFLFRLGPLNINEFQQCKVAVVQRQVSEHNRIAMLRMKERGIKIIYDLDDNIWSLPAFNPGKKIFNEYQDGFWKCAAEADLLTVSTQGLASAARTGFRMNKPILIVPNAVDMNLFHKKDLVRDDTVVVGWGGSNTHSEDVKDAFGAIVQVLDDNPKVRMEIVGAPAQDSIVEEAVNDKGQRVRRRVLVSSKIQKHAQTRFRMWVPVGEFPLRFSSWGWDVALAPLVDNRFNRSKSNIKMLEAAAIKIPCLASDVQPYNEFCYLDADNLKWLLCNSESDWRNKLRVLVNEPERREFLAQKMYDVADTWFNAAKIKANWMHVFRTVLQ